MPAVDLVERTALSSFTLDNRPVLKGQIITVDPYQLNRLIDAGCVVKTEAENARVPVGDFPTLQRVEAPGDDDLRAARAKAQDELAEISARLAEVRQRSAAEIAEIERQTTDRLQAIGREVGEAEAGRDAALADFTNEIAAARKAADEAVKAEESRTAKAAKKTADS